MLLKNILLCYSFAPCLSILSLFYKQYSYKNELQIINMMLVNIILLIIYPLSSQSLNTSWELPILHIKCIPIDDGIDTQHHFLCANQTYQWIFSSVQIHYNAITDEAHIDIVQHASAQFMAKLKDDVGKLWLIETQLIQSKFVFHYIGLQFNTSTGVFNFPHIAIPQSIKDIEANIERAVKDDILDQVSQKSNLVKKVIILGIFLAIIILGLNYWKKKQIQSTIDQKPNDLKQIMLAQMDIKQEENRKNSSGLAIRSSQPPKKTIKF